MAMLCSALCSIMCIRMLTCISSYTSLGSCALSLVNHEWVSGLFCPLDDDSIGVNRDSEIGISESQWFLVRISREILLDCCVACIYRMLEEATYFP
ncbi:hypothetical protein BDV41DRAFT_517516 [Aspergillus transmontanensis]|uniref:Secreted protein n=1 Tax=Aspergillus transmontanensis TaxID=1034304 RepID=A0A5N6WI76_9EURO|nr:hypothetical protein BDV41DRAFT_517516 [Aspergillus transmontanensis]